MNSLNAKGLISKFVEDRSGESMVKMSLMIGGAILGLALVATPMLDKTTKQFAENRSYGIDPTTTASVSKTKRYTLRKSVLGGKLETTCTTGEGKKC